MSDDDYTGDFLNFGTVDVMDVLKDVGKGVLELAKSPQAFPIALIMTGYILRKTRTNGYWVTLTTTTAPTTKIPGIPQGPNMRRWVEGNAGFDLKFDVFPFDIPGLTKPETGEVWLSEIFMLLGIGIIAGTIAGDFVGKVLGALKLVK